MIRFHTIDVDQGTIVPLARLWLGLLWLIETGGKGRQLLPGSINGKDQMGLGPDWTLVRYANPHYATKFKPMFILFRRDKYEPRIHFRWLSSIQDTAAPIQEGFAAK